MPDLTMVMETERTLFDFDHVAELAAWAPTDDVVMGGRSSSRLEAAAESAASFTGVVSLANNGGFASVRTVLRQYNLAEYAGIALRVRGDDKQFHFNLRDAQSWNNRIRHEARFLAEPDWQIIHLPFTDFVARRMGFVLPDAPPLDPSRILSFGFLIADQQAGPFHLEIDWLKAYRLAW